MCWSILWGWRLKGFSDSKYQQVRKKIKDTLHICLPYVSSDTLLVLDAFVFHTYHGTFLFALMTCHDFLFLRHSIKELEKLKLHFPESKYPVFIFQQHAPFSQRTFLILRSPFVYENWTLKRSIWSDLCQNLIKIFRSFAISEKNKNYPSNLKIKILLFLFYFLEILFSSLVIHTRIYFILEWKSRLTKIYFQEK